MRVYVAGPLSSDDPAVKLSNVQKAMTAALRLVKLGHAPFLPHLFYYLEQHAQALGVSVTYEELMSVDMQWLQKCDAFILLGSSPGADRELVFAKQIGLPTFTSVDEFDVWMRARENVW